MRASLLGELARTANSWSSASERRLRRRPSSWNRLGYKDFSRKTRRLHRLGLDQVTTPGRSKQPRAPISSRVPSWARTPPGRLSTAGERTRGRCLTPSGWPYRTSDRPVVLRGAVQDLRGVTLAEVAWRCPRLVERRVLLHQPGVDADHVCDVLPDDPTEG